MFHKPASLYFYLKKLREESELIVLEGREKGGNSD